IPQLMNGGRGQIAKPKEIRPPVPWDAIEIPAGGQTLQDVFDANREHMALTVHKAIRFIQKARDKFSSVPVAVAYSGGKDSLCTLLLAHDALGPTFYVFFADTGLEVPEVLAHTQLTIEKLGLTDLFYQRSAGDKFWTLVEKFGPPARDFRYCCHSLKAQQIISIIEELAGDGKILVFLGQRRYESFARAQERLIYSNSYIPAQISATPIKDWTAFEVWLFLLSYQFNGEPFPLNDLYFQGHERLGCYLCPSMNLATTHLMRETHEALMHRWDAFLETYAAQMGFPPEWVRYGLWRSKKFNKLWQQFAADLDINLKPTADSHALQSFSVTSGFAPCVKGGYSLKGKFSSPLDLSLLPPFLYTLPGEVKLDLDRGVASIKNDIYLADIFADGSIYVRFASETPDPDYQEVVYLIVGIVARSAGCTRCGVCAQVCPTKALQMIQDQHVFDRETCIHCGQCTLLCPAFKLAAREVQWEENEIL
ncbi:MAG TPA: phosphoadenosine phosphosulfate reductase family protein, partial [Candidatus Lokiarchaeia archaeon]|nr:phosphoadenosine phosphosulfate reductase family protein [Candidatus Lokiarchaeia archaeon]